MTQRARAVCHSLKKKISEAVELLTDAEYIDALEAISSECDAQVEAKMDEEQKPRPPLVGVDGAVLKHLHRR